MCSARILSLPVVVSRFLSGKFSVQNASHPGQRTGINNDTMKERVNSNISYNRRYSWNIELWKPSASGWSCHLFKFDRQNSVCYCKNVKKTCWSFEENGRRRGNNSSSIIMWSVNNHGERTANRHKFEECCAFDLMALEGCCLLRVSFYELPLQSRFWLLRLIPLFFHSSFSCGYSYHLLFQFDFQVVFWSCQLLPAL